MPVSPRRSPFDAPPPTEDLALRVPQARVLAGLMPEHLDDPATEWPTTTRAVLAKRAGCTTSSGTITRAMNGLREGWPHGSKPHPGLITRGMVETLTFDIEGRMEVVYRITAKGIRAYQLFFKEQGGRLPELIDAARCTNNRYRKPDTQK